MTRIMSEFRDFNHNGRIYPRGRITLEGGAATLEVEVPRRVKIGHPKIFTIVEPITPSTKVSCRPPTLTIGGSTFTVQDPETLSRLLLAASEPHVEYRRRKREQVAQTIEAVILFLVERAGALKQSCRLELEPRRYLADFSEEKDPMQSFMSATSNGFRQIYSEASMKVSGLKSDIGEEGVRRIFAVIYAAGRAQDAAFSSDGELLANAVALAERATGRTLQLEAFRGMKIIELTEAMGVEIRSAALTFFDAAEETPTCAP